MAEFFRFMKPMDFGRFQERHHQASGLGRLALSFTHPCFAYTHYRILEEQLMGREQQVREKETLFMNFLNALDHPVYVIDAETYGIRMANAASKYDRSKSPPTCHEFTHMRSEPCAGDENHPCPLQMIKKTGKSVVVTHVHHNENGEPRFVELHCHPLYENGKMAAIIEYALDITEKKVKEFELQNAIARVAELSKMELVSQMAAGIFHDFNNALTSILGGSDVIRASYLPKIEANLKEAGIPPGKLDELLVMLKTVEKLNSGILTASKVCSNTLRPLSKFSATNREKEAFNLKDEMESFSPFASGLLKMAKDKGKEVELVVVHSPSVAVRGNPLLFLSAMDNLIRNPIQEFERGRKNRIEISWEIVQEGGQPLAKLSVRNNGPQIPEKIMRTMFKEWVPSTHNGQGTGLRNVANNLKSFGASITCASSPQETSFMLTFQVVQGKKGETQSVSANGVLSKDVKILLVEDDVAIRILYYSLLAENKNDCMALADGESALKAAAKRHFDVVIMDQSLGNGERGTEIAGKLKEIDPNLKIIIMTGDSEITSNGSVDKVLPKPFNFETLCSTINEVRGAEQKG